MGDQASKAKEHVNRAAFEFISDADLDALPTPQSLIEGTLMAKRLTVLYAPPESLKTFVALDWALSIAAGLPWQGRATTQGRVVYAMGEGIGGLAPRVAAWKRRREFSGTAGVFFAKRCPDLLELKDVDKFILAANACKPALIVIDTLARALPGGDEDSAKDMGKLIYWLDRIIEQTGAAVLLIHHTTKRSAKDERGSGALRGAADSMWRIQRAGNRLKLLSEKEKDTERPAPIEMKVEIVELGDGRSSCVIVAADGNARPAQGPRLTEEQAAVLATLAVADGGELRFVDWRTRAQLSDRSFARRVNDLEEAGLVQKDGINYRPTESGAATAKLLPRQCHGSGGAKTTASSPPLRGEAEVGSGSVGRTDLSHLSTTPNDEEDG